jgi:opacity protein-like surface antigen
MPPELVPGIGKIGAEVGVLLAGSQSPFRLGSGSLVGGYIDLPLFDRPRWLHGKISYEISIGFTQSKTTFTTTSNVAQVSNLAVLNTLNPTGGLANVQAAVTGTGPAPFPVTASTQTKLSLLQVIPFAFKYTPTIFDRYRLRPYALAGFGTYVTIHEQNPAKGDPPNYGVRPAADLPPAVLSALQGLYGGQAPFGGPLVAGQISQSPELEARGLPGGHGNISLGYQLGGGVAFRITRSLSLGFDAHYNHMGGSYGSYATYGSRIGFHF